MTDLSTFVYARVKLHSETIDVVRRQLAEGQFDLSATNGRLKVWSERFPEIEPEFLDWAKMLAPNHCLWDIGASIGHFSCWTALTRGARVVAFEPEHQNFATLSLNAYLNRDSLDGRVVPLNIALGPDQKLWDMYIRLYGAGEHTKSILPDAETYKSTAVQLKLDTVLAMGVPKPTHIKIDVDGAEKIVLEAVEPLLSSIESLFIELQLTEIDAIASRLENFGLRETGRFEVMRMSGGTYPQIRNVTYARQE